MNWFYAKDGQQMGPVEESDLQRLAATGVIQDATLVWRSGWPEWKRYGEVRPTPAAELPPELPRSIPAAALASGSVLPLYAGFWSRVAAWTFDGLILLPVNVVVFLAFFIQFPDFLSINADEGGTSRTCFEFALLAIAAVYETVFVARYGATPGKWVCDLRVVRPDGAGVSYGRSLCRHFAKRLSAIFLIGYIIVAFDTQKRGLHDYLCDTRVIRKA